MNETEDRQFEILHHSYRSRWASGEKFAEKLGITKEEGESLRIGNIIF
jgi:biotin operon repressor